MSGFKNFILRGNLVDLAVAVVIGAQFSSLVKQFVQSFISPLLTLFGGHGNFNNLAFTVGKARFTYGAFLTEALSFLISAVVVYLLVTPRRSSSPQTAADPTRGPRRSARHACA